MKSTDRSREGKKNTHTHTHSLTRVFLVYFYSNFLFLKLFEATTRRDTSVLDVSVCVDNFGERVYGDSSKTKEIPSQGGRRTGAAAIRLAKD